MSRWSVYVVRCADGTLYTGVTTDLARRVAQHNAGRGAAYTRARRPVSLVWSRPARSRSAALKREAAIKALPRGGKDRLVLGA
ncbi:MAG: GIY-YIG nuclease family protein [Elusimicrobia bacterium]|nr:GIY-YIG nuclease family protein [Elusimicrobiota bacterium]